MTWEVVEFPAVGEKHCVKKGFVLSICPTCEKIVRYYLPEDNEYFKPKCCGRECFLIHSTEEEMLEAARTREECDHLIVLPFWTRRTNTDSRRARQHGRQGRKAYFPIRRG